MHDPSTVAFDIKSPFRGRRSRFWPKVAVHELLAEKRKAWGIPEEAGR